MGTGRDIREDAEVVDTMLIRARHYLTGQPLDIKLVDGSIASIADQHAGIPADVEADIVAPAYFDLQINGGMGINLTSDSLSLAKIEQVINVCASHGVAAFCPTVITASRETILASMKALADACESNRMIREAVPCFHLEGPFISAEDGPRGAHPREHVQQADWNSFQRWQESAGGRIRLVTLAPEVPGAIKLIEKLVQHGVIVSIGHTAGPTSVVRDAISAGARLSTHLGNGCARVLPRHDNVIWEQLAADGLLASIITDGHHLPWNVVRSIVRCKGLERLIITCDASPLAGLTAGKYQSWGQEVEITTEGKIILAEQRVLAGSWNYTSACVEKMMLNTGLTYAEVHPLVSDHPRHLLGLAVPTLEIEQPANLVLLRQDAQGQFRHTHSIIRGKAIAVPVSGVAH